MQFLTAVSPQSCYTPSWKIEAKYSTRVLTGNWVEERRKVRKEKRWTKPSRGGLVGKGKNKVTNIFKPRVVDGHILRMWH